MIVQRAADAEPTVHWGSPAAGPPHDGDHGHAALGTVSTSAEIGIAPTAPPGATRAGLPAAAVSRTLAARAGGLPVSRAVAGHRPSRRAAYREDPGDVAIAAGLASRDVDGSVVFAPRPATPVQRQADVPAASSADPGGPPPATPPPAAPPAVAAPALVAAADAPPTDMAAMADELYERIERRLRTDLLLERERRGALADL